MNTFYLISQVLALCGMVSIRGFLTVFLYFLLMRLTLDNPDWTIIPEFIRLQAEHTDPFLMSPIFLTGFGVLAVLELAAMRNLDIKEFLVEDFDKYAKPIVSVLLNIGVVTSAQTQEVKGLIDSSTMVQAASFGGITVSVGMVIAAGWATRFLCRIRSAVLETIQSIDPGNDLKLQSVSNYLEEIALLSIFFALVILPPLALALTIIGMLTSRYFQHLSTKHEKDHSHSCAACAAAGKETFVSDCALVCPECGAQQPDVRRVGWFGLSGTRPLGDMQPEQHAFRLLAAHRCRWCASTLNRSHVCPRCAREQWTDEFQAFYVRQADRRSFLLLLLALFGSIPGLLALVLFRPFVVRPLSIHLSAGDRFLVAFVMMFLKLLILVLLVILSLIPVVGALPLLGRYLFIRSRFLRSLERAKKRKNVAPEHAVTKP